MRRLLFLFLSICIAQTLLGQAPPASEFYLGGIQVNEADDERWASTIREAGMNTIEVTVYAKQGDWDSDNIWWDEHDPGVEQEVMAAKKAGLKVILILRVALDHAFPRNKFLWHGMIMPRDNATLNSWFDKYQQFTEKWAAFAAEQNVDVLVVGSEMNALTATIPLKKYPPLIDYYSSSTKQNLIEKRALKFEDQIEEKDLWVRGFDNYQNLEAYLDDRIRVNREWARQVSFGKTSSSIFRMNLRRKLIQERWEQLISSARKTYKGSVSYAANFDNYHELGFWKSLDFIGINAYFPLRKAEEMDVTGEDLELLFRKNWGLVFDDINEFRDQYLLRDKPLLFTELGYIYRHNSSVEPWKGFGFSIVGNPGKERLIVWAEQEVDQAERASAVRALYSVVKERNENLRGILYWKLTTHDYHIPVEPFVLHIAPKATDELQLALGLFLKNSW